LVQGDVARLAEVGLDHLVGITKDYTHWFSVPPPLWQAAVLDTLVIPACLNASPGWGIKLQGEWPHTGRLTHTLPDRMTRTDLADYPQKRLEEAGYPRQRYGSVEKAVYNYLAEISLRAEAIFWDRDEDCFRVERDLHDRIHTLHDVRLMLRKVCEAAKAQDLHDAVERWLTRFNVDGRNPLAVIASGGEQCEALIARVRGLERMADRFQRHVTDDLCGFPLQAMREARIAELESAAAAKHKKLDEERAGRQTSLEADATRSLGDEAPAWLASSSPGQGTMIEWAS
jgi:hypothetical protein